MYAIGQRVWCKSQERVGLINEANFMTASDGKRRAHYLVGWDGYSDFLTGPDDLRAADWQCDGCGKWLPNCSRHPRGVVTLWPDGEVDSEYCFLCVEQGERERRKYERESQREESNYTKMGET